jgi:hypothetical protein
LLAAAAACTVVLGVGLAADQALARNLAHKRPRCMVLKCTTLVADAQVRVYQARNRRSGEEGYVSSFAEWLPARRLTPLGDREGIIVGIKLGELALSGRFVCYALETFTKEPQASVKVYRLNVQTGRRESAPAVGAEENEFPASARGVTDIAVTSSGTLVWIVGGTVLNPSLHKVMELPRGSSTAIAVASAATIEPKSLAAITGHVYWTEGGAARSAPIP